ncbi:MAG: 3-phosphoshikimate 1-carboxyvinyltransferase [Opitutales bacterium]|nr:3-phosphoshikimate 1-carboxyvinyltransferase [Opitutales bacterium]
MLSIKPFRHFRRASVTPPGSKSITNRALILAALRMGTTHLTGTLFSEDTYTMIACLRKLGFRVEANEAEKTVEIDGLGGEIPASRAELFVANAGTAARFLTAMLALKKDGEFFLDGSDAMRKRPMSGLLDALARLGCEFEFHGERGFFPFTMKTHGVSAGEITVDARASSQILSALMQIAPVAGTQNGTGIFEVFLKGETVSRPFVEMTARMIAQFGGAVEARGNAFTCGGGYARGDFDYAVEPDATAASYFAILPFVHRNSEVCIKGLDTNGLQGDAAFSVELAVPPHDLLSVTLETQGGAAFCRVSAGTSTRGFDIDFNAISDTFLTLAAVAPLLEAGTPLTIRGIAHTRKQETDRVAAMACELAKIVGAENVSQTEDSLTVSPVPRSELRSRADAAPGGKIRIATYRDHRVAMSFGILGTFDLRGDGSPWIEIENPECCGKTFPDFFEVLEKIRE